MRIPKTGGEYSLTPIIRRNINAITNAENVTFQIYRLMKKYGTNKTDHTKHQPSDHPKVYGGSYADSSLPKLIIRGVFITTEAEEWNEVVFTDVSRICLQHHDGQIRAWRHLGERMLNSCVMHRRTGPAPGIMEWGVIGYHSSIPLVSIPGTLNSQRYISESLEPVVLPYFQGLATAIFQLDNARPNVAGIIQRFFVNHHIELLSWSARSPDLSLIENLWSMVAQRLTQITSPAITSDQLWQRVEAAWSAVPQEHIQSIFEPMPRRVAAVISNNGGYSGY
ncbi:transposable element Tcb1 transposase [Trichonephila clavipes]|nr:transposable element Tcb1 transposase [Trichonephila clavipes]